MKRHIIIAILAMFTLTTVVNMPAYAALPQQKELTKEQKQKLAEKEKAQREKEKQKAQQQKEKENSSVFLLCSVPCCGEAWAQHESSDGFRT